MCDLFDLDFMLCSADGLMRVLFLADYFVLVVLLCCYFFVWAMTAILAGGIAAVRSGCVRFVLPKVVNWCSTFWSFATGLLRQRVEQKETDRMQLSYREEA